MLQVLKRIAQEVQDGFYVNPNPIETDQILVNHDFYSESTDYKLFTLNGQEVRSGVINEVPFQISVDGLVNGMYVLYLGSNNKREQIKVLIVRR